MRWLMITRKLDPADDRTGFVMRWVEELAARLDQLDVICQEHADPILPENVTLYSMGKEAGVGRVGQAWLLLHHLRRLAPSADGVFCHMIPRYVLFAAPWTRLRGKPLLFWYTHPSATTELKIASRLATHILSAAPGSFPLATPKLHVMGHGIETDHFKSSDHENDPPEIVMVGRLSRIKRLDWMLRAASIAQTQTDPFRLIFVGGAVEHEPDYPAELEALVEARNLAALVSFTGPMPHAQVAEMLRSCAFAANLTPPGSFDKAVLEALLSGKPALVTNPDFLPLLGDAADLLYLPTDASDNILAARLGQLLALSPEERIVLGHDLCARALSAHSLTGLMDRLVDLMRGEAQHG
ncbi:MAG: glycosyltransferase family 4 protein [Anaerolineae bacterium]|nr:glycosyltransferase family 4 protein [Anaerolineae bacterium]